MRRLCLSLWALLLVLKLASCSGSPTPTLLWRIPAGAAGFAVWDCESGEKTWWVRGDLAHHADSVWIRVHEETHLAQMERAGSCLAWWRLVDARRDSLEDEAYCAAFRATGVGIDTCP